MHQSLHEAMSSRAGVRVQKQRHARLRGTGCGVWGVGYVRTLYDEHERNDLPKLYFFWKGKEVLVGDEAEGTVDGCRCIARVVRSGRGRVSGISSAGRGGIKLQYLLRS